jgi:prepilin-type N-terminal cleavage/methylation domain-containing protein
LNKKGFTPLEKAIDFCRRYEVEASDSGLMPPSGFVKRPISPTGFTLIELMLVIMVIGVILFITAPAARDALTTDNLKKASRQLIGLEKNLRVDAVREQLDYILNLDLAHSSFWITTSDMTPEKQDEVKKNARHLPAGVTIPDVVGANNKKFSEDVIKIKFGKNNTCTPAVIHLAYEENRMTLVLNPFLGITGIYDKYFDIITKQFQAMVKCKKKRPDLHFWKLWWPWQFWPCL